jgi:hypothetical protein
MGELEVEMVESQSSILEMSRIKFEKLAKKLESEHLITVYSLDCANDLHVKLKMTRSFDQKEINLEVTSAGECFDASFDRIYHRGTECAYDMPLQLEVLQDIVDFALFFVKDRSAKEEIFTRKGKVLFRRLITNYGVFERSDVFAGRLRRRFGARKIIK